MTQTSSLAPAIPEVSQVDVEKALANLNKYNPAVKVKQPKPVLEKKEKEQLATTSLAKTPQSEIPDHLQKKAENDRRHEQIRATLGHGLRAKAFLRKCSENEIKSFIESSQKILDEKVEERLELEAAQGKKSELLDKFAAMALDAGLTIEEVFGLPVEAQAPKIRGPYKKRKYTKRAKTWVEGKKPEPAVELKSEPKTKTVDLTARKAEIKAAPKKTAPKKDARGGSAKGSVRPSLKGRVYPLKYRITMFEGVHLWSGVGRLPASFKCFVGKGNSIEDALLPESEWIQPKKKHINPAIPKSWNDTKHRLLGAYEKMVAKR